MLSFRVQINGYQLHWPWLKANEIEVHKGKRSWTGYQPRTSGTATKFWKYVENIMSILLIANVRL